MDLSTGDAAPITFDATTTAQPVVSPDGRELVFRSGRIIPTPMFHRLVTGAGSDEIWLKAETLSPRDSGNIFPTDWSSDKRYILFHTPNADTGYDIFFMPTSGDRR